MLTCTVKGAVLIVSCIMGRSVMHGEIGGFEGSWACEHSECDGERETWSKINLINFPKLKTIKWPCTSIFGTGIIFFINKLTVSPEPL